MTEFIDLVASIDCKKRSEGALALAAASLNVHQDVLGAFTDVEASGRGYDGRGRIKFLFEKHHFWKHLGPTQFRDTAAKAGLARPNWIKPPVGYADQKTSDEKWVLLRRAANIHEDAALMSASWGAGQIMGSHYKRLKYANVKQFVLLQARSEDAQIEAMCRFIKDAGLDDEMRRKDWNGLAGGYNGAGQIPVYAPRLRAAYARRAKLPDEPLPMNLPAVPSELNGHVQPGPIGSLRKGMEGEAVRTLQVALVREGAKLALDSDFGPVTEAAVRAFQKEHGLVIDGIAGAKTQRALGMV